jgi:hypothetical protein
MMNFLKRLFGTKMGLKGRFYIEHWREGQCIGKYQIPNGATNIGKNKSLDILFGSDSKISTWYLGLIDNSGYTAIADADTMASHSGWTEFTDYSASDRPTWTPAAASSQAVSNSSPITFTMSGSGTIKGVFCTSDATKSGISGTLWATALFSTTQPVVSSDQLKVTYEVTY